MNCTNLLFACKQPVILHTPDIHLTIHRVLISCICFVLYNLRTSIMAGLYPATKKQGPIFLQFGVPDSQLRLWIVEQTNRHDKKNIDIKFAANLE